VNLLSGLPGASPLYSRRGHRTTTTHTNQTHLQHRYMCVKHACFCLFWLRFPPAAESPPLCPTLCGGTLPSQEPPSLAPLLSFHVVFPFLLGPSRIKKGFFEEKLRFRLPSRTTMAARSKREGKRAWKARRQTYGRLVHLPVGQTSESMRPLLYTTQHTHIHTDSFIHSFTRRGQASKQAGSNNDAGRPACIQCQCPTISIPHTPLSPLSNPNPPRARVAHTTTDSDTNQATRLRPSSPPG
jgi:hypothetical protein